MLYFPRKERYGWEDFLEMMRLLRSPEGCPWDREQTHASIRRNFLEETWEAVDALDRDDPADLCEELGDVLMQAAFHAQIEAERGRFTMEDVVDGVTRKLLYRHPHVFGEVLEEGEARPVLEPTDGTARNTAGEALPASEGGELLPKSGEGEPLLNAGTDSAGEALYRADNSGQALTNWDVRKRREKGHRSVADAVEAVPHTLPALWRAEKLASKTAKAGFDWPTPAQAMEKLEEEVGELREALESGKPVDAPHGIREEIGDTLFMAAKIAQEHGVDPEEALHLACDKYNRRFRLVEEGAEKPLSACSIEELYYLWKRAKAQEQDHGDGS